jgi:hypothetical protein
MWIDVILSDSDQRAENSDLEFQLKVFLDFFNRHLIKNKIKIEGVSKITITWSQGELKNFIGGPMRFSPVVNITKFCEYKAFETLAEIDQQNFIRVNIAAQLDEAARVLNWSQQTRKLLVEMVKKVEFNYSYREWKPKLSKDKKYQAAVEVDMRRDRFLISTIFFSKNGVMLKKIPLIPVRPNRFFVKPLMGNAKWTRNDAFQLTDKNEEILFICSVSENVPEIIFRPNNRSIDTVVDELLVLASSTTDDLSITILLDRLKGFKNGSR